MLFLLGLSAAVALTNDTGAILLLLFGPWALFVLYGLNALLTFKTPRSGLFEFVHLKPFAFGLVGRLLLVALVAAATILVAVFALKPH